MWKTCCEGMTRLEWQRSVGCLGLVSAAVVVGEGVVAARRVPLCLCFRWRGACTSS